MKKAYMALFALCCGSSLLGSNTLLNGNFEKGNLSSWRSNQQRYGKVKLFKITKGNSKTTGKYSLKSCGDLKNKNNNFITLVQNIKITPSPEKTYCLSGLIKAQVKKPYGKSARMAIREVDARGNTVGYQNVQIDLCNSNYTFYEKEFSPSKRTKAFQVYLVLSGFSSKDFVFWDNLSFSQKKTLGKPFDPKKAKSTGLSWKLKGDNISALICQKTGLLDSLSFNNEVIHPAAVNNSVIFVQLDDKEYSFKRTKKNIILKKNHIKMELSPEDKKVPFKGYVEYKIADGFFTEKVTLVALSNVLKPLKLGIRHGINSSSWDKIVCALRPLRVVKAGESTVFSYKEKKNDRNITYLDKYQHVIYPLTLLKNPRGILLAGAFNLDRFITISPNTPQGYFPSLQQNPLSVKQGQSFNFAYNCRFFPANQYQLRDVWREYSKKIHSNNPLLKDFIPYKDRPYRTFYRGAHAGSTYFSKQREKRIFPNSNIWWFGWHDMINETYPVKGKWYTISNGWKKISAQEMQKEITRLQNNGNRIMLYFRQLANLRLKGTKFPDNWYRVNAGGALDLYGGGYRQRIPAHVQKDVGFKDVPLGTFNFDNSGYRNFYIKQVKDALKFYKPNAIGWDMGWRPEHVGIFNVQAVIYNWLHKNYPNKKIVANECGGGPVLFYTDLALLENGVLGGKSEYDFEVCKAFGNAMVCLERRNLFNKAVLINLQGGKTWMDPRGLQINKQYLDYLLSKKPMLRKKTKELGRLCQLRICLRDQALGASPGYLETARPVPDKMLQMAVDTIDIPLIIKSFVVKLPNNQDRMNPLFASAWLNKNKARLVVYNDSDKARDFNLKLEKNYFKQQGWNKSSLATGQVYQVTPEKAVLKQINWSDDSKNIILSGKLEPFSAYMLFSDKK